MIEIKHKVTGVVLLAIDLADLSYADLRDADLSCADLSSANLTCADLSSANLRSANLSCANLSGADLSCANLYSANLTGANLSGADLRDADLSSANLRSANLSSANLRSANLSCADLSGANLSSANLRSANLRDADLRAAKGADLVIAQRKIVPDGTLIVYKRLAAGIIATLEIPVDAQRCNALDSRKCRASKAIVLALETRDNTPIASAVDVHTGRLVYSVGQEVVPDSYDPNIYVECSHGIHFFLTRIEAENY